jgi:hypothetical protein
LEDQGEKSGEVDQAESAKKKPAGEKAIAVAAVGVEEPAEDGGDATVHDGIPIYRVKRKSGRRAEGANLTQRRRERRGTQRRLKGRVDLECSGIYFCGGYVANLARDERHGISAD